MKVAPIIGALLVAVGVGIGCSEKKPDPQIKANEERRAARIQAKVAAQPVPRAYQINGNELLVVDILSEGEFRSSVDRQRCYIWRDKELKTSSISCPHAPASDFSDLTSEDVKE